MTLPHTVIIAGGKGERLGGVRKANLRIGGRRLVDWVEHALRPAQAPLMVATGPGAAWLQAPAGAVTIADLDAPVGGPLAGLAAAVEALQARGIGEGLLVSVAVDTPFLPADFIGVMRDGLGNAPAAYATWSGQCYPPNAIWQIGALAGLPGQVRGGTAAHSLRALQQMLGARPIDWSHRSATDPFANLNTLDDLVTLGRIAQSRGPSPLIHTPGN